MQLINDLSVRIAKHKARYRTAIERVMDSGWLVLGPEVTRFEQTFAAYVGAPHCVTLANGTDAIELALRAMGIMSGERVATAANAGMYSTTALSAIGAEPYFMDVDCDTRGVNLAEVKQAVESGARAVVVTHLYGLAIPEIGAIAEYCAHQGTLLLEDCAQAHGAHVNGKHVGTFGDAASFSFYPTKNLGALGDGGAVVTSNPKLAEQVKLLRQYGWTTKYRVEVSGARNSRLDEIQAAILRELLPLLDEENTRRREIAARYSTAIRHPDIAVPPPGGGEYVAHLYVIRSRGRDALRDYLREREISSDVHYPIPDYRQPIFGGRFANVWLPNTECLVNEILSLPCYPEMSNAEVDRVIDAVNGWSA